MGMGKAVIGGVIAGALALVPAPAWSGGAPVALLIPERLVCAEGDAAIRIGWRYTGNPPGPRWISVELRGPMGERLYHRRGVAQRRWRVWGLDPPAGPSALGVYRTTYRVSTGTEVFLTRVKRC